MVHSVSRFVTGRRGLIFLIFSRYLLLVSAWTRVNSMHSRHLVVGDAMSTSNWYSCTCTIMALPKTRNPLVEDWISTAVQLTGLKVGGCVVFSLLIVFIFRR